MNTVSPKCFQCLRPKTLCFCDQRHQLANHNGLTFLMHPKEYKFQKVGTGRMAHLGLKNSHCFYDLYWDQSKELEKVLNQNQQNYLVYPGEKALTVDQLSPETNKNFILVDGTWAQAKKMMRLSTKLQNLPRVSLKGIYKAQFTIKHRPHEHALSTIECTGHLFKELMEVGLEPKDHDLKGYMRPFYEMMKFQIKCATDPHIKSNRGKKATTQMYEEGRIRPKKNRLYIWDHTSKEN